MTKEEALNQNRYLKQANKEFRQVFKELKEYILKNSNYVPTEEWYFTGSVFDLLNILDQIQF